MSKNLSEWLTTIAELHVSAIDLDLSRVMPLAEAMQLTQFSCPVIVVGGTNGKGSVVRCLESIWLAHGYRVAAYTSPHLMRFNERLRVCGEDVTDTRWCEAFEEIEARRTTSLSFFEFTTLAALWICQNNTLDVLILEVGLGGRLDAVNCVDSNVSVITGIDIDHVDWLGHTRESIAQEKAGIMRQGCPFVCGDTNPPEALLQATDQLSVEGHWIGREFNYESGETSWRWFDCDDEWLDLPVPKIRLDNASVALQVAKILQSELPVTLTQIRIGLRNTSLAGRFEEHQHPRRIIYDVAHNPQSGRFLAERLNLLPLDGKRLAVFSMLKDKAILETIEKMCLEIDEWYIAPIQAPRAASVDVLSSALMQAGAQCIREFTTLADAVDAALENTAKCDQIIVFGSFHTVYEAKKRICP